MALHVDIRLPARGDAFAYRFATTAPVTGVLGASGAGKTTLLHALTGLVRAAGRIALGADVLLDTEGGIARPPHRRPIAYAFQDDRLFPHRSVEANVAFGARFNPSADGPAPAALLAELGIADLARRRIHELSGGERRRVGLARALARGGELLLLDEPFGALDPEAAARVRGAVRAAAGRGMTVLCVSHDLAALRALSEHLVLIRDGHVEAAGTVPELAAHPTAWRALRDRGPVNVIDGTIDATDDGAGLTFVRLGGAASPRLAVPRRPEPVGTAVRYGLRAEDVALALRPVEGTSIQNQLPGVVASVVRHAERSVVGVQIPDGAALLLVEVSHRTVGALALEPGRSLHVLIKSSALEPLPPRSGV